jgi:hypothetical protein
MTLARTGDSWRSRIENGSEEQSQEESIAGVQRQEAGSGGARIGGGGLAVVGEAPA